MSTSEHFLFQIGGKLYRSFQRCLSNELREIERDGGGQRVYGKVEEECF